MALDLAGIKAISNAMSSFGENADATQRLGDQLKKLGESMGIKDAKALIFEMERLNKITSAQASELLKLNDAQERRTKQLENEKQALKESEKYTENLQKKWREFGNALSSGDLPGAIGKLGPAIGAIGGPLATVTAAAMAAPGALVNLGKSIEGMVAKANPAAAFQFNRALDDLVATMGQILTPILNGLTDVVRGFADILQGLKPAFELLTETIGDFLKFIGKVLGEIAGLLGSKGQSFGAAIRPASYGAIGDIGKRTTLNVLNQQQKANLTPDGDAIKKQIEESNKILREIAGKAGVQNVNPALLEMWRRTFSPEQLARIQKMAMQGAMNDSAGDW